MMNKEDIFELICNYFLDCDYTCPRYAKCCEPNATLCLGVKMAIVSLECLDRGIY